MRFAYSATFCSCGLRLRGLQGRAARCGRAGGHLLLLRCRRAAPWRSLSSGPRRCPSSSSRDRHPQACDSLAFSALLLVQKYRAAFGGTALFPGELSPCARFLEPGARLCHCLRRLPCFHGCAVCSAQARPTSGSAVRQHFDGGQGLLAGGVAGRAHVEDIIGEHLWLSQVEKVSQVGFELSPETCPSAAP